jgi:hypothetical protein
MYCVVLYILCGLCMPLVLYCECACGIYGRICSPDGFPLSEEAVFSRFLPAKALAPPKRPALSTASRRSFTLLLECGNGAT